MTSTITAFFIWDSSVHTTVYIHYIHVTRSQPDLSRLVIDPDQMEEEGQLDHTHLQENEEDYQVQTIVRDRERRQMSSSKDVTKFVELFLPEDNCQLSIDSLSPSMESVFSGAHESILR
jgi:hypothetical protein